jgi:hypothetical protein
LINNLPVAENRPLDAIENRPIEQLVHRYGRGKWIPDRELKELALRKYHINGRGITFVDVVEEYRCSKEKADVDLRMHVLKKQIKMGKKSNSIQIR